MKEEPERKDIANKYGEVYIRTAPILLGEMHKFLFGEIENFLVNSEKENRNLLIVGHGPAVLPFSDYPERVSDMLGEKGKIVLFDYSEKAIRTAIEYLKEKGFLKKSGLKINDKKISNPKSLEERTINFTNGNLKSGLPFESGSFNCIDITLTGHHVTPFLVDLDKLTSELYRVLARRSLIHYGEASVYMDSESIINELGTNTADFFKAPVLFVDERDKEFVKVGFFENGKKYAKFPEKSNPEFYRIELILDDQGNVTITTENFEEASRYVKFLKSKKRTRVIQFGNIVSVPLIDDTNKRDRLHFVDPIHGFYQTLFHKIEKAFADDPKFRSEASSAVVQESSNAKKGLNEFYKSISVISRSMRASNFKEVKRKMHKESPFGSIIARKS